ncbi:putative surface protein with fasciclin (FAS1) repeats [Algoriphagus ratkowskyi]|uniref:Fasciclin domain-containing protein n=1 Tax=Algoriphagus ratkowskyi TaxID=57028 RepID=A0A2W7R6F3_9BACT|nr:fasciclin domain-containing protein [Algoriphagus ratkowskyi]PZX53910.1 putative surface protein with fasciclin (FAS1) repeats [Algoriphagus ratkowskyi]TXD76688.1 fasciclin domain-containing protein [Algoriphagus ratkowskyi]
MRKSRILSFVVAATVATYSMSCDTKSTTAKEEVVVEVVEEAPAMQAPNTVVDIAIESPDHTTLVSALQAAGLVETLQGEGPFTVFAPTNAAFEALPAGTVEGLLKPEAKADLTSILTLHVVAGNVMSGDLSDGQMVTTLNGKQLKVSIKDGKVMIGNATVTTADLAGSNGVVHVIDQVLLP